MDTIELNFKCEKYKPNKSGGIKYYELMIERTNFDTVTIDVKPDEIVSHIRMKKILMEYMVVYSTTKTKHDEMLCELFNEQPKTI